MLGAVHPMDAHEVDSQAIYAMGKSPDVGSTICLSVTRWKIGFRKSTNTLNGVDGRKETS